MSVTVQNCIDQSRRLLADTYDRAFSETDLIGYLNEGLFRFTGETHVCQAIASKTITSSTYAFSSLISGEADRQDVAQILKIELTASSTQTTLPKAPLFEQKDRLASTITTPTRYSIFGNSIVFDTAAGTTLSLPVLIYYSYVPAALAQTTDTLPIEAQWASAIVRYMVFCAHLSMRDAGLANGAFQEYEQLAAKATALTVGRMS